VLFSLKQHKQTAQQRLSPHPDCKEIKQGMAKAWLASSSALDDTCMDHHHRRRRRWPHTHTPLCHLPCGQASRHSVSKHAEYTTTTTTTTTE
jgi:hypothetical protein